MSGSDAKAVAQELRGLAAWAVERRSIPPKVLRRAALVIGDDLSVAVATRDEPEIAAFRGFVLGRGGHAEATLFADGAPRADRYWTAVANAMAMTTAEQDEGYTLAPCHAGLYTIPALLAQAEAMDRPVEEMLRAEVLAYEIITRIAATWKAAQGAYPPLYTHARLAAIGAAAASALLRGVDAEGLFKALCMACTFITVGPRNHLMRGAGVRNVWPALGAWSGMMAVEWGSAGVAALESSPHDVFSDVLGFVAQAGRLTDGLGEDWAILHGYTRLHACHLFMNALVESILEIRPALLQAGLLDRIDGISVAIHADAIALDSISPDTTLAARFSVPHLVAAVLLQGDTGPSAFSMASVARPEIAALRPKVRLEAFDMTQAEGHKWPAAIIVSAGGQTFSALRTEARGGHGEPITEDEVLAKIDGHTKAVFPRFGRVIRQLHTGAPDWLDRSSRDVVRALCGPAG